MDLFNPLRWSIQIAAWAAPGLKTWSLERSLHRTEGERCLKMRDYAEAEEHLALAVEDADALRHSVRRIQLRLQLAEAQRRLGKVDEAEKTVRAAIDCAARVSNPSGYVQCLDALAEVFHDAENFPSMEAALQEGVRIEAAIPHPNALRMARRVHRLGIARYKNGRSEDAIPALEKALKLHEELRGPEHPETGDLLTELGVIYRAQGLHAEAQRCLQRALHVHKAVLGRDSEPAIEDLHHLAGSFEESGQIERAAELYERL